MPNTIVLSGFKEFQGKLKNLPKTVMKQLDREVQDSAELWMERSVNDAPIDQGRLKQQISVKKIKDAEWEMISASDYSAFIEWGTRSRVNVPGDLAAYAAQFKGSTGQTGAKEFIYAWCRRKGIDPKLWYVIYRSIMIKGINPHPYVFIQRPFVESFLINNLKPILNAQY